MPRGVHKVKPVKAVQIEPSVPLEIDLSSTSAKPKRANTNWKSSILAANFISRTTSTARVLEPIPDQLATSQDSFVERAPPQHDLQIQSTDISINLDFDRSQDVSADSQPTEQPNFLRSVPQYTLEEGEQEEEIYEPGLDTFDCLTTEANLSDISLARYSCSSASVYSRASSIYSSGASLYSIDDVETDVFDRSFRKDSADSTAKESDATIDWRLPNGLQQRARPTVRRQDSQDAASRERSALAKKAALYKNSRLPPNLPSFSTSLSTWSMVCRAAKASQDCYKSQASTRRGVYTSADSSKDIKAMIVDDQLMDDTRLIIVSIRGTQSQSLTDWTVNTTANPTKPVGFLDEEENACHAGFLQVTKAMIAQVATQLHNLSALSERPELLFTGHSAGGAISAMLYSHMVSTSVDSELTALSNQFSKINCITFGAPPISQTPLLKRDHIPGVFLAFANEGDLVLRTSNAAYFKSLARLMSASPPSTTTAVTAPPPVKVVRGSRGGAAVYRQVPPAAPATPWEDLPLWPTPAPSLTNAGDVILLRDRENGTAVASPITSEDLREVIFGDLAQHTIEMYLRRVKELALSAMFGRDL